MGLSQSSKNSLDELQVHQLVAELHQQFGKDFHACHREYSVSNKVDGGGMLSSSEVYLTRSSVRHHVLKAGFLTKQGGNIKSWKRRYFVAYTSKSNFVIRYFEDETMQLEKGCISCCGYKVRLFSGTDGSSQEDFGIMLEDATVPPEAKIAPTSSSASKSKSNNNNNNNSTASNDSNSDYILKRKWMLLASTAVEQEEWYQVFAAAALSSVIIPAKIPPISLKAFTPALKSACASYGFYGRLQSEATANITQTDYKLQVQPDEALTMASLQLVQREILEPYINRLPRGASRNLSIVRAHRTVRRIVTGASSISLRSTIAKEEAEIKESSKHSNVEQVLTNQIRSEIEELASPLALDLQKRVLEPLVAHCLDPLLSAMEKILVGLARMVMEGKAHGEEVYYLDSMVLQSAVRTLRELLPIDRQGSSPSSLNNSQNGREDLQGQEVQPTLTSTVQEMLPMLCAITLHQLRMITGHALDALQTNLTASNQTAVGSIQDQLSAALVVIIHNSNYAAEMTMLARKLGIENASRAMKTNANYVDQREIMAQVLVLTAAELHQFLLQLLEKVVLSQAEAAIQEVLVTPAFDLVSSATKRQSKRAVVIVEKLARQQIEYDVHQAVQRICAKEAARRLRQRLERLLCEGEILLM